MAPDTRVFCGGTFWNPRSVFERKWNALFDKEAKEWMAFKPALGLQIYPCYSCRHMFYSKKSFLDHVNRRVVLLMYKCTDCNDEQLTFYNRCSFLIHCRKHYNLYKGEIKLSNLMVSTLPLSLAGLSRHPDVPYIFDVEDEEITDNAFMNSQFYYPNPEDKGKETVTLNPSHLVINRPRLVGEAEVFALKQIAKNIPKCEFITLDALKKIYSQMIAVNTSDTESVIEIKSEPEESIVPSQSTASKGGSLVPTQESLPQSGFQDIINGSNENISVRIINHKSLPLPQVLSPNTGTTIPVTNSEEMTLPVITKIETVEDEEDENSTMRDGLNINVNICTECSIEIPEPISSHFLGQNKPETEEYRCGTCKLVCATACSYKAHIRFHSQLSPYVCPDCGIQYSFVQDLVEHMDTVCYHMCKSVRFRCPGRRCGKIFASEATFGPHFQKTHIDRIFLCGMCRAVFSQLIDCENHILVHEAEERSIVRLFSCVTCSKYDMTVHQMKKHLDFHCKDLSRCIYIYMCKYCKCYFRSIQTISTHLKNCKVQKTGIPRRVRPSQKSTDTYVVAHCQQCNTRVITQKSKPSQFCSTCSTKQPESPKPVKKACVNLTEKCVCVLCKKQISFEERRQHQLECQYGKPQILVERLDLDQLKEHLDSTFNSSTSDLESPQKRVGGDSSDESRPKKRAKHYLRPKRPDDLTAEQPVPFTGTYQCCLCYYKNTERSEFHDHVKLHRPTSTAYQCMECGECFVVKPSLIKHLLHFHNISDYERYFTENDCFDLGAVTELAQVVKAPYLANNVKENQCKVCMEEFEDIESHDKHFRTHGMAFLMKNSI